MITNKILGAYATIGTLPPAEQATWYRRAASEWNINIFEIPILAGHPLPEELVEAFVEISASLAVTLVAGLFGAVMCASSSVAREIRSGTALAVLSKPVGRARFILGKYAGLSGAMTLLVYTNLVACLLSSRMAYDAYGSADTVSFGVFCLGGLLAAYVLSGFLNYFFQSTLRVRVIINI